LATTLPHPNSRDFPGQLVVPIKENVKVMITQSGKTMDEPKAKSKKMSPIDPVEEEKKAEAEVEAESRPRREEENLGKVCSRTSVIHTYYHSPYKQRSMWKMKNSATSWK
jgi:hypothetical protein